ncbi:MAG TPA: VWA domain-containing protein [Candidatus Altiarchaeales archaeon]|nr:VWA domain-containing protein [Candidatus Altiarchaeales archaeon]
MKNKGYTIMIDALVALIFVLIVTTALFSIEYSRTARTESGEFTRLHYVSEDTLDVLNKKGILDEIATLWAENSTPGSEEMVNASNLAREYLEKILPDRVGYKLIIEGDEVVNSSSNPDRVTEEEASTKTHSTRLLVGYGRGLPTRGLVARASLSNIREKTTSRFAYFGGFVGQGDISREMFLPDNITIQKIYVEMNVGDGFDLYINNNLCKNFPAPAVVNMSANIKQDISGCSGLLTPGGVNIFQINFTGSNISRQYIGGGFIEVEYNTSEMDTSPETGYMRFYFPKINGIINYYSSFYVPGWVDQMLLNVSFRNNFTTFMYIGDKLIFRVNGSNSTQTITNTSTQLLSLLGSSAVSEKTVPIRIGTGGISYNITRNVGNADVILITDLSGSMRWRIGYNDSTTGVQRNCDDPQLYDDDTRRISLAKCLDKDFVDIILNTTGNRVGLVGFTTSANTYHELSDDRASLINHIDSYPDWPSGGTCVCCAINRAIQLLQEGTVIIPQSSGSWKRRIYTGCGDSCDPTTAPGGCTPANWETATFDDSSWSTVTLPTSVWWWSNRVVYYRKHFTLSSNISEDGTLYLRNRRGVECYLNGNFINADTGCKWGSYWDNTWSVPSSFFNPPGQDNVLACRVRSGSGWSRRGIEFDAKLTVPSTNKKYIIVMTDGITGYHCGGCSYTAPCNCGGSCTNTGGAYDCDGNPSDCTGSQCDTAINDAICSSERAHSDLNATVYSIGFGPVSTGCPNANRTLRGIADCGKGSYYGSQNASELADIYSGIASEIVNASYYSQTITLTGGVTGNVTNATLYGYPESYIEFTYTPINTSYYGRISVTEKSDRFNDPVNCVGHVLIPESVNVSEMKVTSYSAEFWTDYLSLNNSKTFIEPYKLWSQYPGVPYISLGDPYIVNIPDPEVVIKAGEYNNITIGTGNSETERTNCSADDRAIYTMRIRSLTGYGDVYPSSEGCIWDIEFEDGSFMNDTAIPITYTGGNNCSYTSSMIGGYEDDAINDAIYRLLRGLDLDNNGRVDIIFDPTAVEFKTASTGGVRSLWGPVVIKLIIWM